MSLQKIDPEHRKALRASERELIVACRLGNVDGAEKELRRILRVMAPYDPAHPRLLESRLRYFECLLDANGCGMAESGFVGIRRKANRNTRLYLEATFLLGVSLLRQHKLLEAKVYLQEAVGGFNKIKSPATRRAMQKRVVERTEEEALLVALIGKDDCHLDARELNEQAAVMAEKSEEEILREIARALPPAALQALRQLRGEVVLMLPPSDRLALPASNQATSELNLGKRVKGFVKRVIWRTVCDPDSPIYKAWSVKLPEVYGVSYFASAVATAFQNFRIGVPVLAAGVIAIMMKSMATEFCQATSPTPVMDTRRKGKS